MPEKKDSIADVLVEAPVEEPVAPVEDAPVAAEEAPEPTVKVQLAKDYDGPTPVHVSVPDVNTGAEVRFELTESGVDVPEALAPSVVSLPMAEVAE